MGENSKKDKIIEASLVEFAEYGYDKASTDRISTKAGVSKGLIFHYFGSKDNLYMIIINKCIDDIFGEFNKLEIKDKDMEFTQKLIKINKLKYNFFINNPMHYQIIVNGLYNAPKKLTTKLEHRYSELRQFGLNILVDMIKDLPIRKDILSNDILTVFSSVINVIESRYLSYLAEGIDNFEEIYESLASEYVRLVNIVLYGILDYNKG